GRDLLSRIIHAGRVDLAVAFGATALALAIGCSIGVVAGLYRGLVDLAIMRCVDSIMASPPSSWRWPSPPHSATASATC
ncbi:MAG TPA: hypothetical protein VFE12_04560, partial [Acetobacteraceae bacterium]|nr:hypothetical protein [Acetobacteraceae bacterium]